MSASLTKNKAKEIPPLAKVQQLFLQEIYKNQPNQNKAHCADYLFSTATAAERIAIYSNNTQLNLIELLRSSYPVIDKIVGTDFFKHLAIEYIQQHPQTNADRHHFGANLFCFLTTFVPVDTLPFLSDLAQLEWHYHRAYFADDAPPMTFEALQQYVQEGSDFYLPLHPSVKIIAVNYNVLEIWQAHQYDDMATINLIKQPQHLLIWRDPQHTLCIRPVSNDCRDFLNACPDSFFSAMQSIDSNVFQTEFADCMTQGLFIQDARHPPKEETR